MGKSSNKRQMSQKEYFNMLNTVMVDKAIEIFEGFINDTIQEIKNTSLDKISKNPSSTSINLVNITPEEKERSIKLINVKRNHTLRCLDIAKKIMKDMGFDDSWIAFACCIVIFHDIGRFMEAEYCGCYVAETLKPFYSKFKEYGVEEHAGFADLLLFKKGAIKQFFKLFNFDNAEIERINIAIEDAILYHQKDEKDFPNHLKLQLDMPDDKDLINYNLFELILNPYNDDSDIMDIIRATLAQIMKDVDKVDILSQHLTGEFPIMRKELAIKTYSRIITGNNDFRQYLTFNQYIEHWGLNAEEFLQYNPKFDPVAQDKLASLGLIDMNNIDPEIKKLISKTAVPKMLMDRLNPAKLAVPEDILKTLYNGEMQNTNLTQLMGRYDYVPPFTDMCWRWGAFLGALNFTSSKKYIRDENLIWRIYDQYSDECKPYAIEFFSFVQRVLIDEVIDKKNMYTKRAS